MSENIQQAINEVMKAVGYVKQTGRMDKQGYSYTSESDLIEALRPAMNEAGVICMPRSIVEIRQETYTTKHDNVMNRVTLLVQYAFVHAASGTELMCQTVGEGSDAGDKATAKAMTGALKYALRQTFLIETGDDPDKDASAKQERAAKQNGRPHSQEAVKEWFANAEKNDTKENSREPLDNDTRQTVFLKVGHLFPDILTRKKFQMWAFGVPSIADMTNGQGRAYWRWADKPALAKRELDDILASPEFAEIKVEADETADVAEDPAA